MIYACLRSSAGVLRVKELNVPTRTVSAPAAVLRRTATGKGVPPGANGPLVGAVIAAGLDRARVRRLGSGERGS